MESIKHKKQETIAVKVKSKTAMAAIVISTISLLISAYSAFRPFDKEKIEIKSDEYLALGLHEEKIFIKQFFSIKNYGKKKGAINSMEAFMVSKNDDANDEPNYMRHFSDVFNVETNNPFLGCFIYPNESYDFHVRGGIYGTWAFNDPVLDGCIYTITVTGGTANPTSGKSGTLVNLTPGTAPQGKKFKEWKIVSGGVSINGNTFTIGTANVVIEAVWEDVIYMVTVTGGTANPTSGKMGTSVTLTADAPPLGKKFNTWRVVSGGVTISGNTFTIGTANVVNGRYG